MGSTFDSTSTTPNALSQPTLATPAPSEEDEPPSSGLAEHISVQASDIAGPDGGLEERDITTAVISDNAHLELSRPETRGFSLNPRSLLRRVRFRHQPPTDDGGSVTSGTFLGSRNSTVLEQPTPSRRYPRVTYAASLRAAIQYSPLNILLVFIPVSWALHYLHQNDTIVFVFSALAIIPLAAMLGLGTEQIALRTSQSVGGLLNATLGNVVELIIAGIALMKCELGLVQSSLLGGLLSNLLLVLGMAFIVGGTRFPDQEFQPMAAQLNSSLLVVAVISLLVPAAFHEYLGESFTLQSEGAVLLKLSRGSAVILILVYVAYMIFQFRSHKHLFRGPENCSTLPTPSRPITKIQYEKSPTLPLTTVDEVRTDNGLERQRLNIPFAIFLLVLSTVLAYFTAEHLVDSINGLVESSPSSISKEWLALIVIPIVGNAAEHATAIVVARKGKFDLVLGVAVGSCIQISLFVIPVLVLLAWGVGKPLTLLFDPLETLTLFLSVLLVKFSLEDGKSHWMSGVVLVAVYVLIALSFWHFPTARMGTLQGEALTCTT